MEEYKKGDIVVCLPGFDKLDDSSTRGGAGYIEGTMYEVQSCNSIMWPTIGGRGVYKQAIRHAHEYEIKSYKEGIRHVSEVPKPEQIINNYQIY